MQSEHMCTVIKRDMSSRANSKSIYISVYTCTQNCTPCHLQSARVNVCVHKK